MKGSNAENDEILELIKQLACRLNDIEEKTPKCFPNFLEDRKFRYIIDTEQIPLIVHDSILEIKPTHIMRDIKNNGYAGDKVYIRINAPHNVHASPPWYHSLHPSNLKERAKRLASFIDIYPIPEPNQHCHPPPSGMDMTGVDCECEDVNCKWKDAKGKSPEERESLYLCPKHKELMKHL